MEEKKFMDEDGIYYPSIQSWRAYKKIMQDKEYAYCTAVELEKHKEVAKYAELLKKIEKMETKINVGKDVDIDILTEVSTKITELEKHSKKIKEWKKLYKRKNKYILSQRIMEYLEKESTLVAEYAIIHKED